MDDPDGADEDVSLPRSVTTIDRARIDLAQWMDAAVGD
jgi:hypothetical protein